MNMTCPYCGQPMEKGFVMTNLRYSIFWLPETMEVNDLKNKKDSYKKQTLGSKYSPEIAACVIHYQELFGVKI